MVIVILHNSKKSLNFINSIKLNETFCEFQIHNTIDYGFLFLFFTALPV